MHYIVCGWYTPDYQMWADKLRSNLDDLGEAHDIVAVESMDGGWEANTMRKPMQLSEAMRRHPGTTIIFLDVDCVVHRGLGTLANIHGDVGMHMISGRRVSGYGRLFARSGTIVVRPGERASLFVSQWTRLSATAPPGQVDQHTLPDAIAMTPGLCIQNIDVMWCAMAKDGVRHAGIYHFGASSAVAKMPAWRRAWNQWVAA